MSVTVDWWTKIIQVDKAWLTEIQLLPTEIRELNINTFRLVLRTLESGEEGVVWRHTHNHTAPVTFGGVTIARVMEIVNDYTITFEDGQYAVNIVGGNSNIGDRVNVNQVSVRSANSAGLITSEGIEAIEYENGVHLDTANGVIGTIYPIGTHRMPCNNLDDAQLICADRGFNIIYVMGDLTLSNGDDIDEYCLIGSGMHDTLTLDAGVSTSETEFRKLRITGTFSGEVLIREDCHVTNIAGFEGHMHDALIEGNITLAGTETVHIVDCMSAVPGAGTPVIDMGGSGRGLGVRAYSGGLKIINKTGSESVSVDFVSGQLKLASTVTAGEIVVRGAAWISEPYHTGTATIRDDGLINVDNIWDAIMADHLTVGTTGKKLYDGGTGDTDAIAAAVWDLVLYPGHITDDTAGKYIYEFYSALKDGDVWVSSSTAAEVLMVRKRLGDAGTLIAESIIDEEALASDTNTIFTMYQMIFDVSGVWLRSDTEHTGTNYYTGAQGEFDRYTGQITTHSVLPSANEEVLISYTYFRGLHDESIDEFLTEGKLYVKKYTRKSYDWTAAFTVPPDEDTKVALMAAASFAGKRCLEALAAGDILQLGFNFRLGDLEIENMVRGGGFQVQAHIDMLNNDVDRWLRILGRGMYVSAASTSPYGRDWRSYQRDGVRKRSNVR